MSVYNYDLSIWFSEVSHAGFRVHGRIKLGNNSYNAVGFRIGSAVDGYGGRNHTAVIGNRGGAYEFSDYYSVDQLKDERKITCSVSADMSWSSTGTNTGNPVYADVFVPARPYVAHGNPTLKASKTSGIRYGESVTLTFGKAATQGNANFDHFELWQGSNKLYSGGGTSLSVVPSSVTGVYGGNAAYTLKEVHEWYGTYPSTSASVTLGVSEERVGVSKCSASRKSDTQASVTWSLSENASSAGQSVLLERRTDEGGWVQIATLGKTTSNYTDNGISANHRYQYRVRAYNGLYSGYSESGYIYTTPAAPSSVSASATGPTKVAVAAGGLAPYAVEHQVEHRSASGDWGGSKTVGTFPVDMPSVAGLNYYRVRSGRDGLWSGWCESKGITTVAVPLKPTVSGLPAVYALGADAVVSWTPNHPDGSAQTSAELEVTDPGGSTTTVSVEGEGSSASVTLGAVGTWRFRVRTHGMHSDWGAWSGYAEVAVAAPPVITVTSPSTDSAVVEVVPFAATWDVVDVTGAASQTLRLLSSDGSPLHTVELGGDVREYEFRAGTYLPANLDAYVIELSVRGGSTLSATATRRFTTDYAAPAAPIATVEYTPELGTEVTVIYGRDARASDGGSGPVIPTESASVVRAMPDGTQWLVSDGMGDGEKARDPLPPLETGFKYLVTAYSEVGTATTVEVPAFVRADAVAINFGRAASGFIPLKYDVEWSRDYELSTELMDFADGGEAGGLPTAYTTGSASIKGSLSATSLGREDHDALDALARRHAVAWVRDPHGRRALCAIGLGVSGGVPRDVAGVNLSLTETAWREAWDG